MDNLFNVSTAPHIRSSITTKNIMYDVLIALMPATIFGIYQFGLDNKVKQLVHPDCYEKLKTQKNEKELAL